MLEYLDHRNWKRLHRCRILYGVSPQVKLALEIFSDKNFRDFRPGAEKYMQVLGEHYGGLIKPETLILHLKPCLKNLVILKSELFVFSEDE